MKPTIIAKNLKHLTLIIVQELNSNGPKCDLNHIDVSQVTNMDRLFEHLRFHGDISKWDTSQVESMEATFNNSEFNGDISNWNTSKVKTMYALFANSKFNGDISKWNVENVTDMAQIFALSKFQGDLTEWKPYKLEDSENAFENCPASIPYWFRFKDVESRNQAIEKYDLKKELSQDLANDEVIEKKLKI
jgi:surface protein